MVKSVFEIIYQILCRLWDWKAFQSCLKEIWWHPWHHLMIFVKARQGICPTSVNFISNLSVKHDQASFLESLIKDDINIFVTKIWYISSIFTQFALVSCTYLDFENKHWNLIWLSFYNINGQNMLKIAIMEKRFLKLYLVTD